jgi:DNA modification methylase
VNKYLNKITCGDCYELIKQLPDSSVDCIYTDIPYLLERGGSSHSELGARIKKIQTSDLSKIRDGIDYGILDEFLRVMKRVNCFIWCSRLQIFDILKFFVDQEQLEIHYDILVWNKTNPIPATNNSWLPDIEYCLYFREKGVRLNDG